VICSDIFSRGVESVTVCIKSVEPPPPETQTGFIEGLHLSVHLGFPIGVVQLSRLHFSLVAALQHLSVPLDWLSIVAIVLDSGCNEVEVIIHVGGHDCTLRLCTLCTLLVGMQHRAESKHIFETVVLQRACVQVQVALRGGEFALETLEFEFRLHDQIVLVKRMRLARISFHKVCGATVLIHTLEFPVVGGVY